ncbi:phage tail tube protein [Bacillus cereus]|uniref:phage tail tube protein n=1 Tax=Bacillus cereus group TaxID=86661 RepID=UPI0022E22804|nr:MULTISPECIES: phage tail tube protein [Bacillus cereus group]MDA1509573.1 phage tail tube protein [Bacillus cereus group sp. TH36-2LC]MDZ4632216.1 phage tail tube protein [Bacillus cereus]
MATGQKIAGVDVIVKVGSPAIAVGGQSGCTINRSMNVIETTDKTSNGWVTKIGGIKEWSTELEAFMVIGDAGYKALSDAFKNRSEVDVECAVAGIDFKGKALISDFPIEAPQDDAVTFSITLEGTGELVETPVA